MIRQKPPILYCLMGEALCMIQLLEDALSHSITLKKYVRRPHGIPKGEADKVLEKHRSYTLGKAVKLAKEKRLYSDVLQNNLEVFLRERNWLVHKCIPYNIDDMHMISSKDKLFHRIKTISNNAEMLQRTIEDDLIEFSESVGVDMSRVRAAIK